MKTYSNLSVALIFGLLLAACSDQQPAAPGSAKLESLGVLARQGGQASAVDQLQAWAERGSSIAQRELALTYEDKAASEKDAAFWLIKAARGGDKEAAFVLAGAYYNGKLGLGKDPAAAAQWYGKAAAQEDERAALMLSRMAKYGEGMPQDLKQSVSWLQQASANGSAQAMFLLSNAYAAGDGVPQDPVLARSWLEKSAQGDFPPALQSLALAMDAGSPDAEKNPERSYHLLKEATEERRMHWDKAQ
ncbi:tetratricopeptide repeat protein [Collimonas humicola]|uniref:tetratricopeptide repeat protein n=1 Tax=Collimonas humicola TaxID=2825886 RepID=UPI001B8B7F13|nr:tetratricopeptide repeat protein [Collimonas humicola]